MIDVGNDREFGFLSEPSEPVLDRTFAALLTSESAPEVRRRAIQLASFFQVPNRSTDSSIQTALLKGLTDPDPTVRDAARNAVATDLALRGAETDPARIASIRGRLLRGSEVRALVKAIARNQALAGRTEILLELRSLLARDEATTLLPILGNPAFTDAEVLLAVRRAWPKALDPIDRLGLLDAVIGRSRLFDPEEPSAEVVDLLRLAVVDPSSAVRERTLNAIGSVERLRSSKLASSLLLSRPGRRHAEPPADWA